MLVWSGLDSIGPDLIPPKEYKLELAKGMILYNIGLLQVVLRSCWWDGWKMFQTMALSTSSRSFRGKLKWRRWCIHPSNYSKPPAMSYWFRNSFWPSIYRSCICWGPTVDISVPKLTVNMANAWTSYLLLGTCFFDSINLISTYI